MAEYLGHMERNRDSNRSGSVVADPAAVREPPDNLVRFCLEPDTAETKRALAWVNAICLAYLAIGLIGLRPPPIYVLKRPLPTEEAAPVVIEPLISTVQQISPDSTEEAPSEQTTEESAPGVAVTADSSAVAFSVPTVGNVLVPLNMAQAPPAHPMQPAVPISTPHIEQITATGVGGSRPAPPYPTESLIHKEQGTVLLLIEVAESGRVASADLFLDDVDDPSGLWIGDDHLLAGDSEAELREPRVVDRTWKRIEQNRARQFRSLACGKTGWRTGHGVALDNVVIDQLALLRCELGRLGYGDRRYGKRRHKDDGSFQHFHGKPPELFRNQFAGRRSGFRFRRARPQAVRRWLMRD